MNEHRPLTAREVSLLRAVGRAQQGLTHWALRYRLNYGKRLTSRLVQWGLLHVEKEWARYTGGMLVFTLTDQGRAALEKYDAGAVSPNPGE